MIKMIDKESRILIIDDEPDICDQLSGLLMDVGYNCDHAITSEHGLELFKKKNFSLVLLDIWLNNSKFDGFQALEKIRLFDKDIPVIMISGHGNIETAVNSIKKGAYDFIEKPFDSDLLIFKIKKALENLILKRKIENLAKKDNNFELVALSKASKLLEKKINQLSRTDSNILLIGGEGSGKEFLATTIHNSSHRSKKNFKSINCGQPELQLERNLFGVEEGKIIKDLGVLDEIDNGTLYLKNIQYLSNVIQGKILRILEEKKFYRLGSVSAKSLNIRLIASSNASLKKNDVIRNDLLKKLNFTSIEIPSLMERKEDIGELITIFASEAFKDKGINKMYFSKEAISFLIRSECLQNISQLKTFVEWAIIMLNNKSIKEINKNHLIELGDNLTNSKESYTENNMNLKIKEAREEFEKNYLLYNLDKFDYNISKMSGEIGMERTALYRKLKSMKIKTEI